MDIAASTHGKYTRNGAEETCSSRIAPSAVFFLLFSFFLIANIRSRSIVPGNANRYTLCETCSHGARSGAVSPASAPRGAYMCMLHEHRSPLLMGVSQPKGSIYHTHTLQHISAQNSSCPRVSGTLPCLDIFAASSPV